VLAVGTTWRDALSGGAFVVVVIAYAVYLEGTTLVLLSTASATSAVVLLCGIGCTVLAAADLYTTAQSRGGVIFRRIVTVLGTLAVLAGLAGMVTGSQHALEILVVVTIALLATPPFWHVLTIGSER
jgi:hypothetical protein